MADDKDLEEKSFAGDGPADMSLGTLSLTATGEQLDDIQVNLDRMYLESPAPNSLSSGHFDAGASTTPLGPGNPPGTGVAAGHQETTENQFPASLDDIDMLDMSEIPADIENEDW